MVTGITGTRLLKFVKLAKFLVMLFIFKKKKSVFQADVCHAYQLLRKGGLKEENIIVFMYDDIALNEENPRPGVIINSPLGDDVYDGVPKVCFISSVCLLESSDMI